MGVEGLRGGCLGVDGECLGVEGLQGECLGVEGERLVAEAWGSGVPGLPGALLSRHAPTLLQLEPCPDTDRYGGISLIRNNPPVGSYSSPIPRDLW